MESQIQNVSIVIPVYNEEGNIDELASEILKVNIPQNYHLKEVLLIDDGSTDHSVDKIIEVSKKNTIFHLIQFERNYGQTSALSAGFNHASGDIIICLDADLQNKPSDIPKILDKLSEGYDVVSGWRKDRQDPFLRTILSQCANKLIGAVSGLYLHDYGCTLKAYKKKYLNKINLYGEMHRFIPIYLQTVGARISELPVSHAPRKWGESKYGLNRTFKVLLDLLVIRFLNQYSNRPIYLFGSIGFGSILVSMLCMSKALFDKFANDVSLIQTPLTLLSFFSLFMGFLFIVLGLLAELLMRVYYESQNKATYIVKRTTLGE
jgi:glycosyltransferase involved in cell wall biosynthesis